LLFVTEPHVAFVNFHRVSFLLNTKLTNTKKTFKLMRYLYSSERCCWTFSIRERYVVSTTK